jgi:CelD/BcsL family acetyltransferase involved in cellulose biosynthesis
MDTNVQFTVHTGLAGVAAMASEWRALVRDARDLVAGLDATAGPEWCMALCHSHLNADDLRVVVLREGALVRGVLPVVLGEVSLAGRRLWTPSNAYGGRVGLLLSNYAPEQFHMLLRGLDRACPNWVSLDLVATLESPTHTLLLAEGERFVSDRSASTTSPYFGLAADAPTFWAVCSKSTRQLVRSSRNKLDVAGQVEFRLVTGGAAAMHLIEQILTIERESWKHESGTAISRHPRQEAFYRTWFPLAEKAGLLCAALLSVGGRPVAHNFGVLRDGVYCCLKHSHDQSFDKASPMYPLTAYLIDELIARGAHTFDFMGLSESHKLRWSPQTRTYTRVPGRLFRDSMRGRTAAALWRTKAELVHAADHWRATPREPEA